MRRVLAIVSIIALFILLLVALFFLLGIAKFDSITKQETSIRDVILGTLELIGILVSSAVVFIILVQYFRYRRPYRLVFDAFSNEPDLINKENKPLNLSILVQEELIRQIKIIFNEIKSHSERDKKEHEFMAFGADELYIEEESLSNSIRKYVSVDQLKKGGMIEDLKDVIQSLKDSKGFNLLSLIGEIVPKEVAPVSKVIEAIIPPHIIKATAFLQWRSNVSDGHVSGDVTDKVGITFKFVDLSNQRNLMVRTLWWQQEDASKEDTRTRSTVKTNTNHKPVSNEVAERYIDLLEPATYWMVLMFWEQKLLSNISPVKRFIPKFRKRHQARILYLLGTLYYAYADQRPAHKVFFCNLAVEHFREAIAKDANWDLPYLYLANLYTFKAQDIQRELGKLEMQRQDIQNQMDRLVKVRQDTHNLKEKSDKLSQEVKALKEKSDKLSHDARDLYEKALNLAKTIYTRHRIRLNMALADLSTGLTPGNLELLAKAFQQVEELQTELDPADFSWERADCAVYLYNLATWYIIALDRSVTMIGVNALEKARRYLAYSLARSEDLKDMVEKDAKFESMRLSRDIELLLEILNKVRQENGTLAKLTGKDLRDKLYSVSQEIDERKRALFNIQLSDGVS